MLVFALQVFSIFLCIFMLWLGAGTLRHHDNPPPIPCSKFHRDQAIAWILQYDPKAQDIAEIGTGWGGRWYRVLQHFPLARYTGYELLLPLYLFCRILRHNSRATFLWGDVRKETERVRTHDWIIAYMGKGLNQWLADLPRTKPQYFVSVIFEINPAPHVQAVATVSHWTGNIYLYRLLPRQP